MNIQTKATPAKKAVCYLPSAEMLRVYPVKHWLDRFKEYARRTPTEVVLPAVGFRGPHYDSSVHPFPTTLDSKYLLPDWTREVRHELGQSVSIWASVLVECSFFENEALWIKNQYGSDIDQLCISNPVAQEVLKDFVHEILTLGGIEGIVLDITDAYPNSGATGVLGVSTTCFCDHCVRALRAKGFREPTEVFFGEFGLTRFVLKVTETGAEHIDPSQDWIDQRDARSLVSVAMARGFVSDLERNQLEAEAVRLLQYLDARVKVTADSVREIFQPAKSKGARTAVVIGSHAADMTQMVTLSALERAKAADEFWLPDAPHKDTLPEGWVALQFLAGRSSYYSNGFFEVVEKAQDFVHTLGAQRFLEILLNTSRRLKHNKLSAGGAYISEKLPQYDGFVGIPLGTEDHLLIVKRLASEVTGSVLPQEILNQFRIESAYKPT